MRVADRGQCPLGELLARLPPPDVQAGDDDVEAGQQIVLVVQPAVRADLHLAAVEQPKPVAVRALGRPAGVLLTGERLVQPGDDRALFLDALGG